MVYIRGYTIIEMLLVVGILAIVTSGSAARFKSFALRKDAQQLTALMNYAQRRAVESGQQYVLKIDSVTKSFCINSHAESSENIRTNACLRSLQFNDATDVESEIPLIIFYPDSHMTNAAIKLHDRDHSVVLSTTKQWGRVRMDEYAGDERDF